jgi:hypothetical protein
MPRQADHLLFVITSKIASQAMASSLSSPIAAGRGEG